MIFQALKPESVVASRNGFIESFKGDFCVDNDRAIARQSHYYVGTNAPVFGGNTFLFAEVAVLKHARKFDDATQLNLAPASAYVRRAQSLHQIARFVLQLKLR